MIRIVSALATLLLVGALAVPADAQYATPTLFASDTTVVPGQVVAFSGTGFAPNTPITISVGDLAPGTYTVTASGGGVTATTSITVERAAVRAGVTPRVAVSPTGALPRTGSDNSDDYVRLSLALLGVGGLLVAFGRHWQLRRRSAVTG